MEWKQVVWWIQSVFNVILFVFLFVLPGLAIEWSDDLFGAAQHAWPDWASGILSQFPHLNETGNFGYQQEMMSVSVTLLGVIVALILVAYSVANVGREVIRTVVLLHRNTLWLLSFCSGTVIVNMWRAIWMRPTLAMVLVQFVGVCVIVVWLIAYYTWFLRSLDLEQMVTVVKKTPFPGKRMLRLLQPLAAQAVEENSRAQVKKLMGAFVVAASEALAAGTYDKEDEAVESIEAILDEGARQAIRLRKEHILTELSEAALKLLGSVPWNSRWHLFSWLLTWVRSWHGEYLRTPVLPTHSSMELDSACLYLRWFLSRMDDTSPWRRGPWESIWPKAHGDTARCGLLVVMDENDSHVTDPRYYDGAHLRRVYSQYNALLSIRPNGTLPMIEQRSAAARQRWHYGMAVVHLVYQALTRAEGRRIRPLLDLAHELATEVDGCLDDIHEAAAKGDLRITFHASRFDLDTVGETIESMSEKIGMCVFALEISSQMRKGLNPLTPAILRVRGVGPGETRFLQALQSGVMQGQRVLSQIYDGAVLAQLSRSYLQRIQDLANGVGQIPVAVPKEYVTALQLEFSRSPLCRQAPLPDGVRVGLARPVAARFLGRVDERGRLFFRELGEDAAHKGLARLLREMLYIRTDWTHSHDVLSGVLNQRGVSLILRRARRLGINPGLILTGAQLVGLSTPGTKSNPSGQGFPHAEAEGVPIHSVRGIPGGRPDVTVVLDRSAIDSFAVGDLSLKYDSASACLQIGCCVNWKTGTGTIKGLFVSHSVN